MKMSNMLVSTLRDAPSDAVIASHKLMFRAGLIRKLSNGLFAYLPFGLRSLRKVERIVREEMDAIGALEFEMPVVVPGEIWQESGRWVTMGDGMLKAKNRLGQDLVVSPTAEEAFTAVIRAELSSYKQLPIVAYQIRTKFRDEIRPRYGVMRGREFTMKDAYSFHADEKSLDETYKKFAAAYRKIFKRCGLSIIPVRADSGAMGGQGSEEFMIESEIGDNTLLICPECGLAANDEKAECRRDVALDENGNAQKPTDKKVEFVSTPNVKSIAEMEKFFGFSASKDIKALLYRATNAQIDLSDAPFCEKLEKKHGAAGDYYPVSYFCVLIRADLDVNEAKLAALLKASEVELASDDEVLEIAGAPHGAVGPLTTNAPLLADFSVVSLDEDGKMCAEMHDALAGSGKVDWHIAHVEPLRDFTPFLAADVRVVKAGDKCPVCGAEYYVKKGNELGHIFKLGDKYTKTMKVSYLDEGGKAKTPIMGCYGIGIDRVLASIIEENHDESGIVWPMSVAPFQVCVVPIKGEKPSLSAAEKLCSELESRGIEVLLDDRDERPGVKFKDIDLIGIPLRIVISDKTLPDFELKMRDESESAKISQDEAVEKIVSIVQGRLA